MTSLTHAFKSEVQLLQWTIATKFPVGVHTKSISSYIFDKFLFKTKGVGQGLLAAAMNAPVTVMETAGEGGAWGIAVLASYMVNKVPSDFSILQ